MKLKLLSKFQKRSKYRERKRTGNRYTTFLPEMTEGNNLPLQLRPGFTLMDRADPNGWLAGVSRTMATSGTDVGYSIPDVMAVEQQIRRLIRLPHNESMHHQEMRDWRAVLAILLLWDGWEKDEFWPELRVVDFIQPQEDEAPSNFRNALVRAVSKKRAREGVRIFSLYRTMDLVTESVPLALVSSETIIAPAANMAERLMERLLPSAVTWYNREKKRFEDPTSYLSDLDRLRLVMQLRILQEMNADRELNSCLYTGEENQLVGLLEQFIQDLNDYRFRWRNSLKPGSDEMDAMYDRIVAVKGLYRDGGDTSYVGAVERREYRLIISDLLRNPLMASLSLDPSGREEMARRLHARHVEDTSHFYYTYDGIPFAREDHIYILEPMNDPRNEEAIAGIRMEAAMLRNYSNQWNTEFGQSLLELAESLATRVGIDRTLADQIRRWARMHLDVPLNVNHTITLKYPLEGEPETLRALMKEFLGMETLDTIYDVFSDRLMVLRVPHGAPVPFPDGFAEFAQVKTDELSAHDLYGMLPLSERMATWLMLDTHSADGTHAEFVPSSLTLSLSYHEDGHPVIHAGYAIERVLSHDTAIVTNRVRFERVYECIDDDSGEDDNLVPNAVEWLESEQAPGVVLWPNLRLPASDWRAYWLYVSDKSAFTPWVIKDGRWQSMVENRYVHTGTEWLSLQTDMFPTFVLLKHGGVTCGALYNPTPMSEVRADDAITIALDFGTTATAVALRQGKNIFRMLLEKPLHGFMLKGSTDVSERLYSEFLPLDAMLPRANTVGQANVISSMVQLFSHSRTEAREPMVDGCIFDHPDTKAYDGIPLQSLYSSLKWGREAYRKRYVYLYLKQCMVQSLMVARQHGAPSVCWRFALPTSLNAELRGEYVACVTQLVDDVSALTGVPLTEGVPSLLFLSENEADGAYFMHEDMVDVRNGYINVDIGGNTSDISLWLNAEHTPYFEQSMEFGCHRLLFESIEQWPECFRSDFTVTDDDQRGELDRLFRAVSEGVNEPVRRELAMFLFDRWIARWNRESQDHRAPYTTALIALSVSYLFYLCGMMLRLAYTDPEVQKKLPRQLQVCFAGNGGRLCTLLTAEQMRKARDFAWLCFDNQKVPLELIPVQSPRPKQEVALGLLHSGLGHSAQEVADMTDTHVNARELEASIAGEFLTAFYNHFGTVFPEETRLLMASAYEDDLSGLTKDALQHVQMVVNNQFADGDKATLVSYVNSFTATKKAWGV